MNIKVARRNAAIALLYGGESGISFWGWEALKKLGWVRTSGKTWDFTPEGLRVASTELSERVRLVADEIDVRRRK